MILGLIRSHNRTGVKSQYCRHCPCHPSVHPRSTTPQEQIVQLGQKPITPYGDGRVLCGGLCVLVHVYGMEVEGSQQKAICAAADL